MTTRPSTSPALNWFIIALLLALAVYMTFYPLLPRAVCVSAHTTTAERLRFVDGFPRVAVEPLTICDAWDDLSPRATQ